MANRIEHEIEMVPNHGEAVVLAFEQVAFRADISYHPTKITDELIKYGLEPVSIYFGLEAVSKGLEANNYLILAVGLLLAAPFIKDISVLMVGTIMNKWNSSKS